MSMVTTANHKGRCIACYEVIEVGEDIVMELGTLRWQHAKCPTKADDLNPRNPVCTVCWLDHPPGRCDR